MSRISDYIEQRRGYTSDTFVFSVFLLDSDENILPEEQQIDNEDIIDGVINVTKQNGSRRNASITLINNNGEYKPDPDGLVWLDNKFLIRTGIKVNGIDTLFDQGIFVLGEVNLTSNQSDQLITYELLDKFTYLDGTISGTLENEIVIPTGSANLVEAIDFLFTEANNQQFMINYDNKPLIADPSAYTIPFTATEDEGGTFYSLMAELIQSQGLVLYFDREGFPRLELEVDLVNDPPQYEFEQNDKVKIGTSLRIDYTTIKNRGRVAGDSWVDGTIGDANDSITDSGNPINVNRIGGRQFFVKGDAITTDSQAQTYLDYLLEQNQRASETANIQFINLDFLDVGHIVSINESGLALSDDRYVVRQLNIPFFQSNVMTADIERSVTYE